MSIQKICTNCGSILNPDGRCPKCYGNSAITVRTDSNTLTSTNTTTVVGPGTITPQTNLPPHWLQEPIVQYHYSDFPEEYNKLFEMYHRAKIFGVSFDFEDFKNKCHNLLDSITGDYSCHDKFFRYFSNIWLDYISNQRYPEAEKLWLDAVEITNRWETQNPSSRVHKGTPYYFWAVTCLKNNKVDDAFLLMHKAKEEDIATYGIVADVKPANAFITLDSTVQRQFLKQEVQYMSNFLDEKIENYRNSRGMSLSFSDFQNKFLKQKNNALLPQKAHLEEITFYFVYSVFRIKKILLEIPHSIKSSIFGSLYEVNSLFDLCLVVDGYIKSKYSNPSDAAGATFGLHLNFLSKQENHGLTRLLPFTNLGTLNTDFREYFDTTLQNLLTTNYQMSTGRQLQPIDEDYAITYGLRNFGGHRIENQPVIYQNFEELSQRVLNTLFFLVEHCR